MLYPPQQTPEEMQSARDPGVPPQQVAERIQAVGDPGSLGPCCALHDQSTDPSCWKILARNEPTFRGRQRLTSILRDQDGFAERDPDLPGQPKGDRLMK